MNTLSPHLLECDDAFLEFINTKRLLVWERKDATEIYSVVDYNFIYSDAE